MFSGSGSSSAAQPVQLRDPAELVQRATAESLKGVSDWGLNMRVVDLINNSPTKAEYIVQSLMPRLLSKDHAVGLPALAVSTLLTLALYCSLPLLQPCCDCSCPDLIVCMSLYVSVSVSFSRR